MKKVNLRNFDYQKVGSADAAMWRAYYNHQFFKLFWYLYKLLKNQLDLNSMITLRLAYCSAWAAADYRIHRQNVNNKRVLKNITKFYKIMSRHSTVPFDYEKAGELELNWWNVHRTSTKINQALEASLANTYAEIYKIHPDLLKQAAAYRAKAMMLPNHRSDDVNHTDWLKTERLTIKSWQALHDALHKSN